MLVWDVEIWCKMNCTHQEGPLRRRSCRRGGVAEVWDCFGKTDASESPQGTGTRGRRRSTPPRPSLLQNELVDELVLLRLHFGQGFILDTIPGERNKPTDLIHATLGSAFKRVPDLNHETSYVNQHPVGSATESTFTSRAASSSQLWEPEVAAAEPPFASPLTSVGFWLQ